MKKFKTFATILGSSLAGGSLIFILFIFLLLDKTPRTATINEKIAAQYTNQNY
jgi:hypothetical protein